MSQRFARSGTDRHQSLDRQLKQVWTAALKALRELFAEAKAEVGEDAGWNGRPFCLHSTTVEGVENTKLIDDKGFSRYKPDKSKWDVAVGQPLTIRKWNSWPASP